MGRIFAEPPSKWERGHARFIAASERYQDEHDGSLPNLAAWGRLELRYDLNPLRFASNHPNVSLMIDRSREHEMWPRPDHWPINRCSPYQPGCGQDPIPPHGGGTHPQVVPEPDAFVGMGTAILLWFVVFLWHRKTAKKSVVEG